MDNGDVRLQLDDLEAEEARIMRELREMDEKAEAEKAASSRRADQIREDPEAAMSALLLECEKEVRDAKGYIADQGPPLKIVRLKHGETGPRSATYLSRPRNTGVDFTVPVTLKAYTELIKNPIFLNQIREKIKARKYRSVSDYLDDMRLLVRNTAQFNKGPDLAWVVQHARFLLEAAEDATNSRRHAFREIEQQLQQHAQVKPSRSTSSALAAVGKRKRTQSTEKTNGDVVPIPPVGSSIEIYWHPYRKWYVAYITERDGSSVHVRYQEDNSEQVVDLNSERWRVRSSRAATRSKKVSEPANKRRKGTVSTPTAQAEPVALPSSGLTHEDLDSIKIDLFAKFEDLRESVTEQLRQHLDRVDTAILRSDALTRILVQLGDTQASVERAITKVFDKFEKLERRFESVLQSHDQNRKQGEKKEARTESLEQSDVQEKENSKTLLETEEKVKPAGKHHADQCTAEGASGRNPSKSDHTSTPHIDAANIPAKDATKKNEDKTTPILISDDEDPKVDETASADKANASPTAKLNSRKSDEGAAAQEQSPLKESLASTVPRRDKTNGTNNDAMDVDGVPKTEENTPPKTKGEKSPVVPTSRKVFSADTGTTDVSVETVKEKNEKTNPGEESIEDESSGSSSESEDSDESESVKENRAEANAKSEAALKEPRKPKQSRFANRADVEKTADDADSSEPKGNGVNENELQPNHENDENQIKGAQKDKLNEHTAMEEEGSTNAAQEGPVISKDEETVKSGDT